jgi:hypothetical protein
MRLGELVDRILKREQVAFDAGQEDLAESRPGLVEGLSGFTDAEIEFLLCDLRF